VLRRNRGRTYFENRIGKIKLIQEWRKRQFEKEGVDVRENKTSAGSGGFSERRKGRYSKRAKTQRNWLARYEGSNTPALNERAAPFMQYMHFGWGGRRREGELGAKKFA